MRYNFYFSKILNSYYYCVHKCIISVGPVGQVEKATSLRETYRASIKDADVTWPNYANKKGTRVVSVNNVSKTILNNYSENISRWDLIYNSCSTHAVRGLWRVGVPNFLALHPHILHFELFIRQWGINKSGSIYQMKF